MKRVADRALNKHNLLLSSKASEAYLLAGNDTTSSLYFLGYMAGIGRDSIIRTQKHDPHYQMGYLDGEADLKSVMDRTPN